MRNLNKINEIDYRNKLDEIDENYRAGIKREKGELERKKKEYEMRNPDKTFFVPQRKEYKSHFHQKLLEINYFEDRIDS